MIKNRRMRILIDNGHGMETPGKRSPYITDPAVKGSAIAERTVDGKKVREFREYLFTRILAASIVDRLKGKGYDAQRIVAEDCDVSLGERCKRVNTICKQYGSANVLLVSIHSDAAGNGAQWMQARGWSAYTGRGNTKADELATCLYNSAKAYLPDHKIRTDYSEGDPDYEAGFYILKHTSCPAVLTENMYQDNIDDVKFMVSDEGLDKLADLHVHGIIDYINKNK